MRLFLAIDVPDEHKLSIEKSIQELRLALPEGRWTPRESWHVTVKFLGEVPDDRYDDLLRVSRRVASSTDRFTTRLTEVGGFPNFRRPRVIWVGLDDEQKRMSRLAKTLERDLGKRGFRKEGRDLHPHLTLARFRVPRVVEETISSALHHEFLQEDFEVTELVLYQSHLSPKGADYEALGKFPFSQEAGSPLPPIPPTGAPAT